MSLCLLSPSEALDSILPGHSLRGGADSSYFFPSFLRRGQLVSYRLRVGEVPPGPDARPKDSNRPQAPCQRPLEHRFRPDPPLDIGGLPAVT